MIFENSNELTIRRTSRSTLTAEFRGWTWFALIPVIFFVAFSILCVAALHTATTLPRPARTIIVTCSVIMLLVSTYGLVKALLSLSSSACLVIKNGRVKFVHKNALSTTCHFRALMPRDTVDIERATVVVGCTPVYRVFFGFADSSLRVYLFSSISRAEALEQQQRIANVIGLLPKS